MPLWSHLQEARWNQITGNASEKHLNRTLTGPWQSCWCLAGTHGHHGVITESWSNHGPIMVQSWCQVWSASDMMRILTLLQQLGMIGAEGPEWDCGTKILSRFELWTMWTSFHIFQVYQVWHRYSTCYHMNQEGPLLRYPVCAWFWMTFHFGVQVRDNQSTTSWQCWTLQLARPWFTRSSRIIIIVCISYGWTIYLDRQLQGEFPHRLGIPKTQVAIWSRCGKHRAE